MRLIDLDVAIEKIKDEGVLGEGYAEYERIEDVCDMLEDCPTVEAVEVIRCGVCKHGSPHEDGTIRCSFHSERNEFDEYGNTFSVWMEPADFCSYGERRKDE